MNESFAIVNKMKNTCLSFIKQGWFGLPLFFLGLVTLAFSQLEETGNVKDLSADQIAASLSSSISQAEKMVESLVNQVQAQFENEYSKIENRFSSQSSNLSNPDEFASKLNNFQSRFLDRGKSLKSSIDQTNTRLLDSKEIFNDLSNNFAGRMEETRPALLALNENISGTLVELEALSTMASGLSKDFAFESASLNKMLDAEISNPTALAPPQDTRPTPTTSLGRKISSVIRANEALPLRQSSLSTNKPNLPKSANFAQLSASKDGEDGDVIAQLRKELNDSKNFQTELSADSAELKSDLRKAYREIVSLQTNLKESQLIIDELENSKRSLFKTTDGGPATSETVSKEINRLERQLEQAREDLRQSRQSLLLEQQRSNAMITSITTELDRTRRELDQARQLAHSNGASYERIAFLERELAGAQSALQRFQSEPVKPGSDEFVDLQEELRKSLAEIARMQIELSEKDQLQEELLTLKTSMEQMAELPSRSASPAYVNKLLVELNAANSELEKIRNGNLQQRADISADVVALEDELQTTKTELEQIRKEFASTREDIAKREFEFATTIKRLEEEAQRAESILQQAAEGKMPVVPFVSEMEEDLAASESRIRLLSDQFASEQKQATEVIDQLNEELELAQARHKKSLDQLARRELELTDKGQEVEALIQEKKDLEEELQVVKVIAGQLQDLNQVLEDTKESHFMQSKSSDQVLDSLKQELNRAKIELVVALEEKEKLQDDFSSRIKNLELQLEDARNEMLEEQDIFNETTNESKILVSQLKTELDEARKEIASMKSVGISDSVETRQAVSQLQEALGTIKILQESLQEAEASNLEVDNLRSELADVMSGQLEKFKVVENEKSDLNGKIANLEAEIAILRKQNAGSEVAELKSNAELQSKLNSSNKENERLRKLLSQSEEIGVSSLVFMEDELANLKNENDELKTALQGNIASEQEKLGELENELALAKEELNLLKEKNTADNDLLTVSNENRKLHEKLELLQSQLAKKDEARSSDSFVDEPSMIEKAMDLEMKLEMALAKIEQMEVKNDPANSADVDSLEQDLALANDTIDQLNAQIENMISKQAESELELAMLENASIPQEDGELSNDEKTFLMNEINALREELQAAKEESSQTPNRSSDMIELQEELRQAVADSFELQLQLEQTQKRMRKMEEVSALDPNMETLEAITAQAEEAQAKAQARIEELTNALRNSELLRSETEDLVSALEKKATEGNDISNDPRFIELQQEMLALQNDLISIQQMTDPRVKELEEKLQDSKNQGSRIKDELQGVMNEFSNLKSSLVTLEEENKRLRDVSLVTARNQANVAGEEMQRKINNLNRENANLTNQIQEKDTRIKGLRDELLMASSNTPDAVTRNQVLQLQMQLQVAEDASNQAKLETQRVQEELVFANKSMEALQSRIREFENSTQTNQNMIDPLQLRELEDLKSQNNLLKDQIAQLSSVPASDDLQNRIKDLNQRNLALTVELDQERIIIDDLKNELTDARSIKQEIVEKGKASKLKADLLNEELSDAKIRIQSLEKALIAAREAIRVLQGGGANSSMVQVSNPSNFSNNSRNRTSYTEPSNNFSNSSRRQSLPEYNSVRPRTVLPSNYNSYSTNVQNELIGGANLQIEARVQFLDNKVRPAGFTEFFLVDRDLASILSEEGINPPSNQGIQTHSEYWARSVQRGYQFPGVAAQIRNALARSSLRRIKTNSLGVGNVDDLRDGEYYIIGASTLGQVGVVWSKPINLSNGDNIISLDLNDASWAQ